MKFYTSYYTQNGKVHQRGYNHDGTRFIHSGHVEPLLFSRGYDPKKKAQDAIEGYSLKEICEDKTVVSILFDAFDSVKVDAYKAVFEKESANKKIPEEREVIRRTMVSKAKDAIVEKMSIHGLSSIDKVWTNRYWPSGSDLPYDLSMIRIAYLDIEVESENGWPEVYDSNGNVKCEERINVISIRLNDCVYLWTLTNQSVNLVTHDENGLPVVHRVFKAEEEHLMLKDFLETWVRLDIDIVTGWNINGFDMPYLVHRINEILGVGLSQEDEAASLRGEEVSSYPLVTMLSPFGVVEAEGIYEHPKKDDSRSKEQKRMVIPMKTRHLRKKGVRDAGKTGVSIRGIQILDYFDLFRKFTPGKRESYKLGDICEEELGVKKVTNPYKTMKEFYNSDFNLFIQYNIRDTNLVSLLDQKLKLIPLAIDIASFAKVNYEDVFSPVKIWDSIILDYLHSVGKYPLIEYIPSIRKVTEVCRKEPDLLDKLLKKHKSAVEFLYNGQIEIVKEKKFKWTSNRKVEIDRESVREKFEGAIVFPPSVGLHEWVVAFDLTSLYPSIIRQWNLSPETKIKASKVRLNQEALLDRSKTLRIQVPHCSLAANGTMYSLASQGFLGKLIGDVFDMRVDAKNKMKKEARKAESTGDKVAENNAKMLDVRQQALKILINACYGATGNEYFRFYDREIAEAVTLTGQIIIQWLKRGINEYINVLANTKDQNYFIAGDTDSTYFTFSKIVENQFGKNKKGVTDDQITDWLDDIIRNKVEKHIELLCDQIFTRFNCFSPCLSMKREAIASKAFWTAKKRYAAYVIDNEGVRYAQPKVKITGLEAVKSTTPKLIREWLKEGYLQIFTKTEKEVQDWIKQKEKDFYSQPIELISMTKGVKNISGKISRSSDQSDNSEVFVDNIARPLEGSFTEKGTPHHVKSSLVHNLIIANDPTLSSLFSPILDGDQVKYVPLKGYVAPFVDHPIKEIAYKEPEFLTASKVGKYVDMQTLYNKVFLSPFKAVLEAIGWSLSESGLEEFFTINNTSNKKNRQHNKTTHQPIPSSKPKKQKESLSTFFDFGEECDAH